LSPDSKILAYSDGAVLHLWDMTTGKLLQAQQGHHGGAGYVSFTPDGKLAATSGADSLIRLWDIATGKPAGVLKGHEGEPASVEISFDGKRLASAAYDGTVRLWDLALRRELRTFRVTGSTTTNHVGKAIFAALSSDTKHLTAMTHAREETGYQTHVETWDAESGKLLSHRVVQGDETAFGPGSLGITRQIKDGILIEEPTSGRQMIRI